ncbi:MAG TPA: phosphotransferase [Propionibacteriaceae bacterium]
MNAQPDVNAHPDVNAQPDADGSELLASPAVADLLAAAAAHAGGSLVTWRLDHIDASPGHSTTATYVATVDWPRGRRDELFGASVRVGGRSGTDERAVIFGDGDREVAVWLYPDDPDLPGLRRAAVPEQLVALLIAERVVDASVAPRQLALEMISYRPRRRAVLKAVVTTAAGPLTFYVKVLREGVFADTVTRHELLLGAGIPAPLVSAATADFVLVLKELPGRPLARAIFDEALPCRAEDMVALLDALPATAAVLPRRPPWTDAVTTYAEMVERFSPTLRPQLRWLVGEIGAGLAGLPPGQEATHGDFHEGQVFVSGGRISGLLDIDTVGPGRRADDLACMVAHLSTVQRMNVEQAAGLSRLISLWLPAFDARVDPYELRLRAAGVIISLATGPYRGQEPHWERETAAMIATAEALVRSLRRTA